MHTQLTSAVAEKAQRGVMEQLLVNHPLDCPMCDKGGECPLQNQAMSTGQGETRFHGPKRHFPKPVALSAQVLLDRERCIQCTRCTRFADEIAGEPLIDLFERGPQEQIGGRRRRAVRLLLLRQHRAGLPGRGAHRRLVPVPGPTVRPGLDAQRVRALRGGLPAAHRPPARRGHPAAGRRRPAGQRGVELRQGPVGVHLRDAAGPAGQPAGPGRGRCAAARVLAGGDRGGCAGLAAARGRAAVLTGGRLTLEDSYAYAKFARLALASNDIDMRARPHSAEETQFLAGSVAGQSSGVTYAGLERARRCCWPGSSRRTSRRSCSCGCARRPGPGASRCTRWPRWPAPGWR